MNDLNQLSGLGLPMPTPGYLFGAILFGFIGFAAWRYGRRTAHDRAKWIGVALMLYPYLIYNTVLLYVVGAGLCLALYLWRK